MRLDLVENLLVAEDARDVGQEQDPPGAEPDRERRGHVVGVHIQRPLGERRDHRDLPGGERVEHRLRLRRNRSADVAQLHDPRRPQADLVADQADRMRSDRGAELVVDADQRLAHDADRDVVGDTTTPDERALDAGVGECSRDLPAAAVNDHRVFEPAELRAYDRTADLDHHHVVYSELIFT
jgi:hypothetical protein